MLREQAMEYISSTGEETLHRVIGIFQQGDQGTDLSELPPAIRATMVEALERAGRGEGLTPHNEAIKTLPGK